MSESPAWISAIAAVVSVVFAATSIGAAIWATIRAGKAHKDSLDIQAQIAGIEDAREKDRLVEKTKASIRAQTHKEEIKPGVWAYRMDVKNTGLAAARNIELKVAGHHRFAEQVSGKIERIEPEATHPIILDRGWRGTPEPLQIEITWEDDSGSRRFKTTLSF